MVFNSDPGLANDNRRFFSRAFIEKLNRSFDESKSEASSIKSVFVIFSKIDLLIEDSNADLDGRLKAAKNHFTASISNIETVFGTNITFMVTSAKTNHNILNLLQNIVRSYDNS